MAVTSCLNDDGFGPVVKGCRNDFDFTIKFELIIFSLIPSSIFVLIACRRCLQLYKRKRIGDAGLFLATKLVGDYLNASYTMKLMMYRSSSLLSLHCSSRDLSFWRPLVDMLTAELYWRRTAFASWPQH